MVKIIAVAGGSGSGKTTFCRKLFEGIGPERSLIIAQDSYYHDQSDKFDHDGGSVNFDHPESLDFNLLATHLKMLLEGQKIEMPSYDFATHTRSQETSTVDPLPIILLDGTLILSQDVLRPYLTHKIFIQTEEELRLERRLRRDIEERGRTKEGVLNQFYKQVKPMHDLFVEPSKENADMIVDSEERFETELIKLLETLK